MAKRRAVHHRIFEVTATLFVIAVVATLRSVFAPAADETIPNVAAPIGILLQGLQARFPLWSAAIWCSTLFLAGLNAGRYGVKYSLYPAYTLMSIPLLGAVAATITVSGDYLVTSAATILTLLAVKYIMRCIMRTGSYGDLSLSMLCFGALPLVFAPAAVVYAAMPLLVLAVKAKWRDWTVAVVSLAFPLFACCYVSWFRGEEFLAPALRLCESVTEPSGYAFLRTLNPAGLALIGVILTMAFCAVSLIISDRYSLKVKSRAAMRFNALLALLLCGLFFLPSGTATIFALVAVPASILMPLIFVRMGTGFTELLYRLLLLCAAANIAVMGM